ncbi:hypothetical protein CSQ96_19675 [Janthinobacterium sp. BJB412]|nr:hypothetical protein CSQ96_19675 [Janthinobacterium sp. BJB412]
MSRPPAVAQFGRVQGDICLRAAHSVSKVLAQLLYASTLVTHAWVRRGGRYVNTVSSTAWAEFRKYLDLAKEQLQKTEALAAKDST